MCDHTNVIREVTSLFLKSLSADLSDHHPSSVHGCILPGLGTYRYHFSPILLPTRKLGTIRHLENGGNQNFTEAFVTLIVTMLRVQ